MTALSTTRSARNEAGERFRALVTEHEPVLTALDERSGDGDFGANLRGGVERAAEHGSWGDDAWPALATTFLDEVGGTSGPLFGLLFDRLAAATATTGSIAGWAAAGLGDGLAAIQRVGEAEVGDRTLVDALAPAVAALRDGGDLSAAVTAGVDGAVRTAGITARRGRASYVGDRAVGAPDPGAVGVALLLVAVAGADGVDVTEPRARLLHVATSGLRSSDGVSATVPAPPAGATDSTGSTGPTDPGAADTLAPEVDAALSAAAAAAAPWAAVDREARSRVLRAVADALDAAADELVAIAGEETHLADGRLRGELQRTTFQLRLFGEVVTDGGYLDARVDHEDPDWPMGAARPDLRRMLQPLGPVLVFAASNFPFAFSVAGGDTAAALAAGCPVIVKAHPGHPRLSERCAEVVRAAASAAGAPDGLFGLIAGEAQARAALGDDRIAAAAFTGSTRAGRALFDIATARAVPIPFFGELGSVNPVVVTAGGDAEDPEGVARAFVASMSLGAGQFCTKPGVLFVPEGSQVLRALAGTELPGAAPMLNDRIEQGYRDAVRRLAAQADVDVLVDGSGSTDTAPSPTLLHTTAGAVSARPGELLQECFGPAALVVTYQDDADLLEAIDHVEGQLTATIVGGPGEPIIPELVRRLALRAGRLLWNQWPTGVSVTHAQQHGGPYPATTAPSSTSVGTAAIERFLRPVAYQGFPESLLPTELADGAAVPQRVDGRMTVS